MISRFDNRLAGTTAGPTCPRTVPILCYHVNLDPLYLKSRSAAWSTLAAPF
ncbi:MAG: hypothetical protein LAO79_25680 [Acidobacteriia bacterium]|nr:hypothetical protein [Terriglobia bacterium]